MERRATAVLRWLCAVLSSLCIGSAAAATRPNVLLIIVDDMGFADLGSFGGEIATPNLDRLALNGIRFTDFQVMPACSPTRAALYTGVDPHLAGLGGMYEELSPNQQGQAGYEGYLNDSVVSVATLLGDAGYRTYLSGKWHLGNSVDQGPRSQGFQRAFSLLTGGASHFADMRPAYAPDPEARAAYVEDGERLETLPPEFTYSTQYYADRLLQYLREDAASDSPFFAVLAYTAPHWPLQAPDAAIAKYRGRYDAGYDALYEQRSARLGELGFAVGTQPTLRPPKAQPWDSLPAAERQVQARAMEVYAAMVDEVDVHTGRVIDYLRSTRQLDNTLVVFMSDNGPEGHDLDETWPAELFPAIRQVIDERHDFSFDAMGRPGSYTLYGAGWARAGSPGLRMYKGFASEGGTRVAAFVHYPAAIAAPAIESRRVSVKDIAPTVLDFAGVPRHRGRYRERDVQPMQGQSIRPLLQQGSRARWIAPVLGVELFGKYALRDGDWKLLVMPPPYASGQAELYNLARDPGETTDLAATHPQTLQAMLALWDSYRQRNNVILPDWVSGY